MKKITMSVNGHYIKRVAELPERISLPGRYIGEKVSFMLEPENIRFVADSAFCSEPVKVQNRYPNVPERFIGKDAIIIKRF